MTEVMRAFQPRTALMIESRTAPPAPYLGQMATPQTAEPTETEEQRRERLAWRSAAISEARREIDREGGIPIEDVKAWVDSWGTPNELPMPEPRK